MVLSWRTLQQQRASRKRASLKNKIIPGALAEAPLRVHFVCFDLRLTVQSLCLLALVVRIIFIVLRAVFPHSEFGERPLL